MDYWLFVLLVMDLVHPKFTSATGGQVVQEHVVELVAQVMEQYFTGCRLVLLTNDVQSSLVTNIIRELSEGVIVIEGSLYQQDIPERIWEGNNNCRALILHLNNNKNASSTALRVCSLGGASLLSQLVTLAFQLCYMVQRSTYFIRKFHYATCTQPLQHANTDVPATPQQRFNQQFTYDDLISLLLSITTLRAPLPNRFTSITQVLNSNHGTPIRKHIVHRRQRVKTLQSITTPTLHQRIFLRTHISI
ncbi:hypothetical protein Pmani_021939 [Petrolisthes manimaculis]|uniref:Uncharacterized protein n=1 Tax=Petrolisthes manimaculis TaxID=1843537 RepID=A0AAE1U1N0_9EUCA|nr:hypothetical protein Pmani_021939 [Petrolisthes manimaculis]